MNSGTIIVEEWHADHPRWADLPALIEAEHQTNWALGDPPDTPGFHMLVALLDGEPVGFLMFLVQTIGPADNCPPLERDGVALTEGKIRAFGVLATHRKRGIGSALQQLALRRAAELGCYQVRSWSEASYEANYAIKMKLGFAATPHKRGDRPGYYWVKTVAAEQPA